MATALNGRITLRTERLSFVYRLDVSEGGGRRRGEGGPSINQSMGFVRLLGAFAGVSWKRRGPASLHDPLRQVDLRRIEFHIVVERT